MREAPRNLPCVPRLAVLAVLACATSCDSFVPFAGTDVMEVGSCGCQTTLAIDPNPSRFELTSPTVRATRPIRSVVLAVRLIDANGETEVARRERTVKGDGVTEVELTSISEEFQLGGTWRIQGEWIVHLADGTQPSRFDHTFPR